MNIKILKTQKASIWLAIGHQDHMLAARKMEFAIDVFKGKYGYAPVKAVEVEYYIDADTLKPNVIQPKII